MILFSKEQKAITETGVVSVDVQGEGYLYVTTKVFSEALALSGKYSDDIDTLLNSVEFKNDHGTFIKEVASLLPSPLNMLTPFFNLIDNEEIPLSKLDLELAFGMLGMIAKEVNFYNYALGKYPTSINYSTPLLTEYELSCQDIECTFGLVGMATESDGYVDEDALDDVEGTTWDGIEDEDCVVESPEYVKSIDDLVAYYSRFLVKKEKKPIEKEVTDWNIVDTEGETTLLEEEVDSISFIDQEVERLKKEFAKQKECSEDETMPMEEVV